MNHQPIEAIIFDLDGTLIDTETADFAACQMLYQELGLSLNLTYWADRVVGVLDGYDILLAELVQTCGNGLTTADLRQRLDQLWGLAYDAVELMPAAGRLVSTLYAAGYPLAVATASDCQWAERWLSHFQLEPYFQAVATGDVVAHNKPAPDVFLLAAEQLNVGSDRCLVFEDSVPGVTAAKAAGMQVVAVPGQVTKSLDFSRADAIIPNLRSVTLDWIRTFGTPTQSPP